RAALLARERGRRCLLDDLLVAPLRGAVALAEAQDVAAVVGGDLHLEMAGSLDEPFQQQPLVTESGRRHPPGTRERFTYSALLTHALHADAAATCDRLEHHRIAGGSRGRDERVVTLIVSSISR